MKNQNLENYSKDELIEIVKGLQAEGRVNVQQTNPDYKDLLEELPIGVFLCDRRGVCHYMNPMLSQIIDVPPRASAQEIMLACVHPEDRLKIQNAWSEALVTGNGFRGVCRLVLPTGQTVRAAGRCQPIKCQGADPDRWLGTLVILDPEVQGSHVFSDWQPLAEHSRDFLIECNRVGKITFANSIARKFLGDSINFLTTIASQDAARVKRGWDRLWAGHPLFQTTCLHTCENGNARTADWVISRPPDQAINRDRAICLGRLQDGPDAISLLIEKSGLTLRETQVLVRAVKGLRNADISEQLNIQESTVKFHLNSIFRKTRTRNRTELTARVAELDRNSRTPNPLTL